MSFYRIAEAVGKELMFLMYAYYLLYVFFFYLLPGFVVASVVKNREARTEDVTILFLFGAIALICAYYVSKSFAAPYLIDIIPLISLLALAKFKNGARVNYFYDWNIEDFVVLFFLIVLSFIFNSAHMDGDNFYFNQDSVWHLGNVAMFSNFNVDDLRLSGSIFKYHFAGDLLLGIDSLVSKIAPWKILLKVNPLLLTIIFFLSYRELIKRLRLTRMAKNLSYIGSFFSLCASGWWYTNFSIGYFFNGWSRVLYTGCNNVALSIIFLISTVLLIFDYREVQLPRRQLIGIACAVALVTMTKGVAGLMLVAVTVLTSLICAVKERRVDYYLLFAVILPFTVIYLVMLEGSSSAIQPDLGATILRMPFYTHYGNLFHATWWKILVGVFCVLAISPAGMMFFLISASENVFSIHRLKFESLMIFGLAVAGFIGVILFSHRGNSQLYFLYIGLPFIILISSNYIASCVNKTCLLGAIIFGSIGIVTFVSSVAHEATLPKEKVPSNDKFFNRNELAACQWIKHNTLTTNIIVTNRMFVDYKKHVLARWFYYSAFSERRFYLEGYDYLNSSQKEEIEKRKKFINKIFSHCDEKCVTALRRKKISYVLERREMRRWARFSPLSFTLVFQNRDTRIYKILNK